MNPAASTPDEAPARDEVRRLAEAFIGSSTNKRAVLAVRLMLERGTVTTDDLERLGYRHAPRAIRDVREAGIPVDTKRVRTSDGKTRASYSLGAASDIRSGRLQGRSVIPKSLKVKLIRRYGEADAITGARLSATMLQVDHRIPYEVSGDAGLLEEDVESFMLLDASSQRLKSWSCEHCRNFVELREPGICKACYWAFPESYNHVAMQPIRRTDVIWQGEDIEVHDRLARRAAADETTVSELIKRDARSR